MKMSKRVKPRIIFFNFDQYPYSAKLNNNVDNLGIL